MKGTTGYLDRR